jgi:pyruvate dehydrogenase E2 component (dihydrolipoamide acetyltransferase)
MTAHEFLLPDIGEGLVEAEIVQWLVPVGGEVKLDESLVEVETAKAVTEIPSPYAGRVLHHGAAEGEVLEVGRTLAVIGEPGDRWPPEDAQPTASGDAKPIVGSLVEEPDDLTPVAAAIEERVSRVPALPPVRRLARDLGIDLASVAASGPGGRVRREDVEAAAARAMSAPAAGPPSERRDAPPPLSGDERRPLGRVRMAIAANMSRSWAEIPQVTAFDEVDATRLLAARTSLQKRLGVPLSIDALVVASLVPALREVPVLNSSLDGDELVYHSRHDIGIAVDTPDGVMIVVIADAGSMGVRELGAEVARLSESARSRTLRPHEASGQTFTLTNIGAANGGWGTPMVPYGTVGILSIGRAKERPIARDGQLAVAPVMPLSLSFDHRVADGAAGRRFLSLLIENLSEPALLLASTG